MHSQNLTKDLSTTYRGWKILHTWTTHFRRCSGEMYDKFDFVFFRINDEENAHSLWRSELEDVKKEIDERIQEKEMLFI